MKMYEIKEDDKCHIVGCPNIPKHVVMRLAIIFIYCDEHLKEFEMNVELIIDEERNPAVDYQHGKPIIIKPKEEQRTFGKEDDELLIKQLVPKFNETLKEVENLKNKLKSKGKEIEQLKRELCISEVHLTHCESMRKQERDEILELKKELLKAKNEHTSCWLNRENVVNKR